MEEIVAARLKVARAILRRWVAVAISSYRFVTEKLGSLSGY